ncbi:unnamed protein product [Nippostrongylus brasiliensis]|uniref:Transposase n=1 Tax=Nippostrongylus brasiliensis TaxID=27835 RepID=A0A0N4XC58_NIPBR|nr:unnamed protein product [Nippostrongylus brasiliensis]
MVSDVEATRLQHSIQRKSGKDRAAPRPKAAVDRVTVQVSEAGLSLLLRCITCASAYRYVQLTQPAKSR